MLEEQIIVETVKCEESSGDHEQEDYLRGGLTISLQLQATCEYKWRIIVCLFVGCGVSLFNSTNVLNSFITLRFIY